MRKICLVGLLVLIHALGAAAQFRDQGLRLNGILSEEAASRWEMHQSASFSMAAGGGAALGQALYLNSFSYRYSKDLRFNFQAGILQQSFLGGPVPNSRRPRLVGSAELLWRPSANTILRLCVSRGLQASSGYIFGDQLRGPQP